MILSIVMATYNGELYIKQQLDSIIPYLGPKDEIIVSDDGSNDQTERILSGYISKDPRIKFINGPKKGVVKNFENALFAATGDIILFSDQDDIWQPKKLSRIRTLFEKNPDVDLILHDMYICSNEQISNNEVGITGYQTRKWRHGVFNNLLFSAYYGCCMAMRSSFIKAIIPFPDTTIAYDQLVGLVAEKMKTSLFLKEPLIKRRIHGSNMSRKLRFFDKISFRFNVWRSYREAIKRL